MLQPRPSITKPLELDAAARRHSRWTAASSRLWKGNHDMTIKATEELLIRLKQSLGLDLRRPEFTQDDIEQAKADFVESLQRLTEIWGFTLVRKLLQAVLDETRKFEALETMRVDERNYADRS